MSVACSVVSSLFYVSYENVHIMTKNLIPSIFMAGYGNMSNALAFLYDIEENKPIYLTILDF
jgi:hypothetical protein